MAVYVRDDTGLINLTFSNISTNKSTTALAGNIYTAWEDWYNDKGVLPNVYISDDNNVNGTVDIGFAEALMLKLIGSSAAWTSYYSESTYHYDIRARKYQNKVQVGIKANNNPPTATITLINGGLAVLSATDDSGIQAYYYGTNANPSESDWTNITITTSFSTQVTPYANGTFYFWVMDTNGATAHTSINVYNTQFQVTHGTPSRSQIYCFAGGSITMPSITPDSGYEAPSVWTYNGTTIAIGASYSPTSNRTYTAECTPSVVLPEMSIKAGGVWKTGLPYIKVNGQWKQAEEIYIKLNGTWKQEG